MTENEGREQRIPIKDKRVVAGEGAPSQPQSEEKPAEQKAAEEAPEAQHDYLDDLRRVQADYENFRKRTIRERTELIERANARLIERLLPVLDNFERALEHGEGGSGVDLVYKELRKTLEDEGLQEIPAEGERFDPNVHEAVESVDDHDVDEPVVRRVYRKGYRLKDHVLRAAMVVVANPGEPQEAAEG